MIEALSEIISLIGGAVTSIGIPLIGLFMFHDSKKRSESAKAKLAEAEALKAEQDNVASFAEEWKALYEQRDKRVDELNAKIDQLYLEKETDRQHIRELQEKCQQFSLDLQAAKFLKCEVKGCKDRQPPTGY